MVNSRTVNEYLKLLQSLLPKGKAWTRDPSSTMSQFLMAIADELVRLELEALSLLEERDTRYSTALLPDHEYDLGLPDECSSLANTLVLRRNQAHSKLTALGGAHKQYFIDLAANLGYTITIEEYPDGGLTSIFHWQVVIGYDDDMYLLWFTSGGSVSGDPICQVVGTDVLECFINRYKPAHTKVFFTFEGPDFSNEFSSAFDAMPAARTDAGDFDQAFSAAFNVCYGGAFDFNSFTVDFNKPL
jgi:uncharacterized protein YmfQ (DUF2313 family)